MWLDFLFIAIFLSGIYYLISYRINLKKAAELSRGALFPIKEEEFASILLPNEWKEMGPLSKEEKSYKYVHWATIATLVLLTTIMLIVLTTDFLGTSFFSVAYFFFAIISMVRHRGNLFILAEGMILNGRFYSYQQMKSFTVEEIIRWHPLYGLDDRVNNAYKLMFKVKWDWFQTSFVVVRDLESLEKIQRFLQQHGVAGEVKREVNSVGK